ncbi:MAG: MerR family transcriptional regulator [Clostridia bacterium]|nr:MerR family transcriptional regulator [Clostridia bacterium]
MPQYTTGEIAKLCSVTVRTVQYYDTRGILTPGALSEGGRRLYREEDLKKMRIICFLRDLGFSIDSIGKLFAEEDPGSVISLLLDQQEQILSDELSVKRDQVDKIRELKKELRSLPGLSVESIGDAAFKMENKKKLTKMRLSILFTGIPVSLMEVGGILLWALTGQWWLFAVWVPVAVAYGIIVSRCYFKNVAYICPHCHEVFRPPFKEAFWANHTPNTRKLTCPKCSKKSFCVETWGGE